MNGVVRKLAWVAPSEENLKMRAARTSIRTLRAQRGLPEVIPRSSWTPTNYTQSLGKSLINNQQSCSGCTGWSAVQAFRRMRLVRGMPDIDFSGAFTYAMINGGRDNGSVIVDAMESLRTDGCPPRSMFDLPNLYAKQVSAAVRAEAAKNRLLPEVTVDDFDECATALLMGFFPQFPISVGGNFERFNGDGVAGLNGARQGNHSVHGGDLVFVGGDWGILVPNTWGNWGPFVQSKPEWAGCCIIRQAHINNCAAEDDGYAHVDATWPGVSQ